MDAASRISSNNKLNVFKTNEVSSFKKHKDSTQLTTLKVVGDIVLPRSFPQETKQDNTYLNLLKPYLQGEDLLIGNLEGAITNFPTTYKDTTKPNLYAFRFSHKSAEVLKKLNFDLLHIANNHTRDFYDQGLSDTKRFCDDNGILTAGLKGQTTYRDVNGVRFSFVGFHYANPDFFNSLYNIKKAVKLIQSAKENSDVVVVTVHAGAEGLKAADVPRKEEIFLGEKRGNIYGFSRQLIDNGADLIIGFGPHIVRPVETYKGKLIVYSMGNFLGYGGALSTRGNLRYSLIMDIAVDAKGNFVRGKITPLIFDYQGVPQHDKAGNIIKIINKLNQKNFPQNILKVDEDGVFE